MGITAIIDYGLCNLDSVARAVEECGGKPLVTADQRDLVTASHMVLPGVGAFATAMERLRGLGLDTLIRQQALVENIPFLGICLGMQLMATRGYEGRETAGLDLIPGEVVRLQPASESERVPHIGWNEVQAVTECPLLSGISAGSDFYFVHSYHVTCDAADIAARTPYAGSFVSVTQRRNMFGAQFHPEKSQRPGFQLLRNFLSL